MRGRWLVLAPCLLGLSGCQDMWQQPKYQPLQPSRLFDDGASARPLVPGVIAQENPRVLTPADTGLKTTPSSPSNGDIKTATATEMTGAAGRVSSPVGVTSSPRYVARNPIPITRAFLERGRERYDINCSPCHGFDGYGRGMVIQRGFPSPPSFHIERLQTAPAGHYFDVITNGYGAMYSYADRVKPRDRWAIEAYIRALQRSQNATLADVPAVQRPQLEATP